MTQSVNPEMIQLARESRGLNRTELALKIGVTQPYISQLETSQRTASPDVLGKIADGLEYPVEFLTQRGQKTGLGLSGFFYRKKASTKVADLRYLEAEINIRRLQVRRLLDEVHLETPYRLEFFDIDDHSGAAERIAQFVRANWRIPMGPIPSLVGTIERAGGIVFKFPFGTRDIDAVSQWLDDTPPLFFVNSEAPADRVRFSLAHELGHILMHRTASETMEREADSFASEFLMPAKDIASDLGGITILRAASLKPVWRVSMAALIRRARDLARISPQDYRRLFRRLSVTGQRRKELVEIPGEQPSLLSRLVQELFDACGHTVASLAEMTCVSEGDFLNRFGFDRAWLRVV